jgi:hypothetical protein
VIDGGQVGADRRGWMGGNVVLGLCCKQSPLRQLGHGAPAGVDKVTVTLFADKTVERAVIARLLDCWKRPAEVVAKEPEPHAVGDRAKEGSERHGQHPVAMLSHGVKGAELHHRAAENLLSVQLPDQLDRAPTDGRIELLVGGLDGWGGGSPRRRRTGDRSLRAPTLPHAVSRRPRFALNGKGELVVGLEGVEDLFRLCLLGLPEADKKEAVDSM